MGVRELLTVCLERQDECTEAVDLVEIARQRDGIELIVDFNCFKCHLYKFWSGLSAVCDNPYIKILGCEYTCSSIERYVTKLIEDLKSLGIQLVFFTDGANGSSTEAFLQKEDTWIKRDEQAIENISKMLDVCRGGVSIQDLDDKSSFLPPLLTDQLMAAAKKCWCEYNQNPAGEADLLLIRALREREKAYAILSNDLDFCIYPESRFIPMQLFDIENDLQLGRPVEVPEKPLRLEVKVITTEKVMSMLQVRNHTVLVEMTIVSGNDYTRQFMRGYHRTLGFQGRVKLEDMACWMSKCGIVECNRFLSDKMLNNHHLLVEMSIASGNDFTRSFMRGPNGYHSRLDIRGRKNVENITGWIKHNKNIQNHPFLSKEMLIEDGIRSGQYPRNIMSMHNNFYWYRMLLENNSYAQPCSECALTPLRAFIYRIVLPRHENLVNEYGRSPYENMRKAGICIWKGKCSANWFDRYGRKNGFTVYLLRYFLQENWHHNLHLSENEYLALVAMAFSRRSEAEYQKLVIRPSVRCVTIGNWFQDVYRHACSMLESLFHSKHEFPLPSEIFCGSVWTVCKCFQSGRAVRIAASQVPLEELYKVQGTMNSIIKEKRHTIRHIVEGFFPFDDR